MTSYSAKIKNLKYPIIVQVSFKKYNFSSKKTIFILNNEFTLGHSAFIGKSMNIQEINTNKPIIYDLNDIFFKNLNEDDILHIFPEGKINILWEKRLNQNDLTLFITNQCNAQCIMCPQPPKKDDYSLFNINKILLEYLRKQPIKKIGITGGEPTIKKNDLINLLKLSYLYYPDVNIDLLTNAKKLNNFNYTKKIALSNPNIKFCISFPTDNPDDFNKIIGTNIYTEVIHSIQNLAILKQNIELRIVIMKQNSNRLLNISEFIYRNFPFVSHIAFMGMEVVGYAFDNINDIDVNIKESNEELLNAIRFLNQRDMNISIYNIPYCLINKSMWKFLRNSISTWKQMYPPECNLCSKKSSCPGIFTTSKIQKYELSAIID